MKQTKTPHRRRYIYGKKLKPYGNNETQFEFNLPATARVLDGINFVIINDQELPLDEGLVDVQINNEDVLINHELRDLCIRGWSLVNVAPLVTTNYRDEYHPTPRPLSGSDIVRIRFHGNYWSFGSNPIVYVNFHYQPKQ